MLIVLSETYGRMAKENVRPISENSDTTPKSREKSEDRIDRDSTRMLDIVTPSVLTRLTFIFS